MRTGITFEVCVADRARLEAVVADRNSPQKHVWRAGIILATAAGAGTVEIMRRTGKSKPCVWRWQERFMAEGVDGLLRDKTRPSRIPPLEPGVALRIVDLTLTDPPAEATHWTAAMMAGKLGVSVSSVQRIWRAHGLQPHRVRQFKLSKDANFADKLRDVVGLYVDPPAHAIVLSVDEKSQIQIARSPACRFASSTARSSAATCSVIAIKNSSASSTRSRPERPPARSSMPFSTTTPSTHPKVRRWLDRLSALDRLPVPGSTPLLRKTRQRRLKRGVFHSVVDLQAAINCFVAEHNASEAKPFRWTADPDKIISAVKRGHQALDSIH